MSFMKVFHWGPIFTLVIIKSIVWSTLNCNSIWWPPRESFGGLLNSSIFLLLAGSTLYNFLYSLYVGPGYLPLEWKPTKKDDSQYLQYCTVCQGFKAPRSHHCRKCNRCILKRDHHCFFINNCVGHANHTNFIVFLVSAIIGCSQAAFIIGCTLYRALHPAYYYFDDHGEVRTTPLIMMGMWPFVMSLFSLGLGVGVVCAVGFLFYVQMKAVLRNRTGIEDWVLEKAYYRREGTGEVFHHPYDVGTLANFYQVINWQLQPKGDGIVWDVRDDCNQYTFTMEQIEQKKLKRERSLEYIVEKDYSGRWFPILSFGLRVSLRPPCTDEKRVPLRIGDRVAVTRWKRYWLYGEILERNEVEIANLSERRALRGWFPRPACSVCVVLDENDEEIVLKKTQ